FGVDFDDPMEEIKKIKQIGSVREYQAFLLLPLGSCGVVLGVQWLLTLGDIKMNFRTLTIEFYYQGKRHILRGSGKQILSSGAGKLARIASYHQSHLCIIQVVPSMCNELQWYSLESKGELNQDPRLLALLNEFKNLFAEPTQLPPSRGLFDHRIMLHNGIEPINNTFQGLMNTNFSCLPKEICNTWAILSLRKECQTDPQKAKAVRNWPTPTTTKQVRGFFGLAGYYMRFIQGFGIICKPLSDLLKKYGFKWLLTASVAFNQLK
ncbi:putative mitochondrial protein, partial [Nicotiana attenuata]